jgi:diphthamide synthase (EF-2-diphthine--ammonia ligase)
MERVLMSWSGGKDSAMALSKVLGRGQYEVAALLTTVTRDYERISMYGVRRLSWLARSTWPQDAHC